MAGWSDVDPLLVETIDGLLSDRCTPEAVVAAEGSVDSGLWSLLVENGLTLVGVPESDGGSGGTLFDAAVLAKAAGRWCAPAPLADSLIGAAALVAAGRASDLPSDGANVAIVDANTARAPWGPSAGAALGGSLAAGARSGANHAGEPWFAATVSADGSGLSVAGALSRSLLMAGALNRAVELSVQYVGEREQFGRPIGKFQALQHYLSEMASESAAAEAAADAAAEAVALTGFGSAESRRAVAVAKVYAGRAAGVTARLAHQIHGAIGFTDEHRLGLTTRRLWSWRDEFGTEAQWAADLGRGVLAAGGAALWPSITSA